MSYIDVPFKLDDGKFWVGGGRAPKCDENFEHRVAPGFLTCPKGVEIHGLGDEGVLRIATSPFKGSKKVVSKAQCDLRIGTYKSEGMCCTMREIVRVLTGNGQVATVYVGLKPEGKVVKS